MPMTLSGDGQISTLTGQVCFFAMQTAPEGFLACSGQAVSRTTYSALFSAIGTTYGVGDGSTTFNLPDLRGEFIRGWDNGRGVDSARGFASSQGSANLAHNHTGTTDTAGAHTHSTNIFNFTGSGSSPAAQGQGTGNVATSSAGAHSHTLTINNDGGTEARPRNVALLACIKF